MPEDNRSPNVVFQSNLAILAAALDAGADAVLSVLGDEATSTQINGQTQKREDIQQLLAAQLAKATGA